MDNVTSGVDLLSVALVREYLSRKGYKITLNQFDKESKKGANSIQNRKVLAEELDIIDLIKKNKERGVDAFKSFLEMIVYHFAVVKDNSRKISRKSASKQRTLSMSSGGKPSNLTNLEKHSSLLHNKTMQSLAMQRTRQKEIIDIIPDANIGDIALNTSPQQLKSLSLEHESLSTKNTSILASRRKKIVHSIMMHNTCKESYKHQTSEEDFSNSIRNCEVKRSSSCTYSEQDINHGVTRSDGVELTQDLIQDNNVKQNNKDNLNSKDTNTHLMSMEHKNVKSLYKLSDEIKMSTYIIMNEVTSDDLDDCNVTDNYEEELVYWSEGISLDTAVKLKNLILGSATICFNNEWKQQGFQFCQHPLLKYGLVQDKGGPCGLMASVQAMLLKYLLFENENENSTIPQPTLNQQKVALTNAFANILKLISKNESNIIVALPSPTTKFTPSQIYKNDNLTEKLQLFYLSEQRDLEQFLSKNILQFMGTGGCILFLYSAVLTCGIEHIRNTMDEANGTLIGSHGYCTQEMVNMLLTGKPVSNVFDGIIELDSGGGKMFTLHGIKTRNNIGFLSLFEHYQSCKVGDNYKNSSYPIWVVCSESHFSVLFSPVYLSNVEKSPFDLYYYDGLGRQDEEIMLTITTKKSWKTSPPNTNLIPPLEHCIRTKWSCVAISWNGSEPIL